MSRDAEAEEFVDFHEHEESEPLPGFVSDPVGVLKRRWKWMVPVIILGVICSGAYLYLQQPSYTARATVMVSSQRISEKFFESTVEGDQLEKVSAILGELLSRKNLARLIEEHNLYADTDVHESMTVAEKVGMMRRQILIGPDSSNARIRGATSSSTIFEVIFTAAVPATAAAVTNSLAGGFTDIHLRLRSRQARLTTEFLRRELEQIEAELGRQERSITEFKQEHRGELPSELQTNLRRLDRLQDERQSLALQIAEAESRLTMLAASGNDVDPDAPESLLRGLKRREREQRTLYTEDHPNLVSLRNQIQSLEAQIAERIESGAEQGSDASNSAAAAQLTLTELRRQLDENLAEYSELDSRVARVPEREEELAAMEQRAEILRESHQEFLRKVNQAELAQAVESAQQGERASILDAAVPPTRPDSSPLLILIVLTVGSLGASVALAILLELLDSVIVTAAEIENRYRLPVLGSISRLQ